MSEEESLDTCPLFGSICQLSTIGRQLSKTLVWPIIAVIIIYFSKNSEIKWIFSFQLLPPRLKRRINMHFPTIWNWKFVNWKKLLKFLLICMKYSWIFFKKKCFHKSPFSKRIHWPLIRYKTCLKTYKNALILEKNHANILFFISRFEHA